MVGALQKLNTVEFAPIGIWKLDPSFNVVDANHAAGKLLGVSCTDLIGKNILELVPALPRELFIRTLQYGESVTRKQIRISEYAQPSHSPRYWEMWLGQLKTGKNKVTGLVLSTVEVTDRELMRQQREDFMSALAHNLKSPLVGADMILDSLMRGGQGPLTAEQAESLKLLKDSNLNLLETLQELIEVYRYETNSANLTPQRVVLKELIDRCLKRFELIAGERHITLKALIDDNLDLIGDQQALKKLFCNLIENALKYTPAGGAIRVEAKQRGETIVAKVSDTGSGINLEDAKLIFERFWQGEPGKRYSAVTGLGLYLCRQIVQAHHGRIQVDSKPEIGTTFSITLPTKGLISPNSY